jgi:16S rRNA (adenine1518-N6/adenine1519-N6)-dimethyltransferase
LYRRLLRESGFRPKKRLGQHFLVDESVLEHILAAAELRPGDVVIEVGPGLGILTEALAKQGARVIAVELDSGLVALLRKRLAAFPNVRIVHADILKVSPGQLLGEWVGRTHDPGLGSGQGSGGRQEPRPEILRSSRFDRDSLQNDSGEAISSGLPQNDTGGEQPGGKLRENPAAGEHAGGYKVIANLPYYITSPVLSHFLEAEPRPSKMVVMVQKEVGETIAAGPGRMRFLSVKAQFYGKAAVVSHVPASSFYPPPKVVSVVLRLDLYPKPPLVESGVFDVGGFFEMVMHGFSAPRKQLRNSLAHSLEMPPGEVALLLEKAGIEARRRAETLSMEEWGKLWKVFSAAVCPGKRCAPTRDSSVVPTSSGLPPE